MSDLSQLYLYHAAKGNLDLAQKLHIINISGERLELDEAVKGFKLFHLLFLSHEKPIDIKVVFKIVTLYSTNETNSSIEILRLCREHELVELVEDSHVSPANESHLLAYSSRANERIYLRNIKSISENCKLHLLSPNQCSAVFVLERC